MALERVQKTISNAGYCSRRKAEELIAEGRVFVNGKPIKLGDKADPDKDKIDVDGNRLKVAQKRYYLLNKPKGYVTTLDDPFKKKTIAILLAQNGIHERVYPVGRLDENTEGLLILTNDGDFANRIMHPRYETEKTYEVETTKPLEDREIEQIRRGVTILGRKTWPAKVKLIEGSRSRLEITIHEGRNRIIRRVLKKLGYSVNRLRRTAIGPIGIGNLHSGRIRELKQAELSEITKKD